MDQIGVGQLKTHAVNAGKRSVSAVAQGGVAQQVSKQEVAAAAPLAPKISKDGGVASTTTPDGFLSKTADSGMSLLATSSGQEITLPTGEAFRFNDQGVTSLGEGLSGDATLTKTADGLQLISFKDKDQNTIQIQPESLTYEVLNKQGNLAQVYHPDGHHEIVAFGTVRNPDGKYSSYENHAVFNPAGEMVASEGFSGIDIKGKKLSFDLGNGVRTERSLVRPLPGQPPFEEAPATGSAALRGASPLTILGEQPPLASGEVVTAAPALVSSGAAAPVPFGDLTDISQDFFAGSDKPGVSFDQTPSKLVMRREGDSRSFLLPNGDSFRTDGQDLQVLGATPRAKNARIVDEGESQLLAYSDPEGNRHTLDINTGDYEVSNRTGSLTQGLKADGTTEYGARGTYTSESGKPQQYLNQATFSESGTLLSKTGFDDLQISGDSLSFSLPNGQVTDRKLVQPTEHAVSIPKKLVLTGGVADEWGDALALADSFLNPAATAAPAPAAPINEPATSGVDPRAARAAGRSPGLTRTALQDGSGTMSVLPNGITIVDGKEISATDAAGLPLAVQKSQLASETGENYLLSVIAPDGIGYTVSNQNLDMIVQSADGKVHQLVGPSGKTLTSIMDNGNQHLHEWDSFSGAVGTPGTNFDPRFPDRLSVEGAPGGGYQLPHPMGGQRPSENTAGDPAAAQQTWMPGGPQQARDAGMPNGFLAGPGGVQQGFKPGFWQRFKNAFTGENAAMPNSGVPMGYQAHGFDPRVSGYPGNYQQFDPVAAQWQQIQRNNQMMMFTSLGGGMMNQMALMTPMFFGSPFGMF